MEQVKVLIKYVSIQVSIEIISITSYYTNYFNIKIIFFYIYIQIIKIK